MAQRVENPTSSYEEVGSIPGLTPCVQDLVWLQAAAYVPAASGIWHCCGFRPSPAATAAIRPPAWKLPYASGAAMKERKKKEKKKMKKI